ncbi:MAG: uroporphyrinogen-III C-methyltransferase [Coriobacteriia bacterium]
MAEQTIQDETASVMYPVMLDLAGRRVLVVGAGEVARRRIEGLIDAGAVVTAVAPSAADAVCDLATAGRITWHARPFDADDVSGAALVLTATGDPAVDGAVASASRAAGIPVNAADDDASSDFHLPAVARRGLITIAVGTAGVAPALAARLRDRVAAWLGPEWERFAALLGEARVLARERFGDPAERMRALRAAAGDNEALAAIARGERVAASDILDACEPRRVGERFERDGEFVSLVGAGPGAPDLLTLRAYDRLRVADVVLYDDLVDRRVLDAVSPEAELVYAGKRGWRSGSGRPGPEALVRFAREGNGRRVVRLKGGDPGVFGRSAEEITALEDAGVPYEIVPGVTAAFAAAASAGIPLTERGVASSVTLATAVSMGAEDPDEPSAAELASLVRAGRTVAVYMGLRTLPRLVAALSVSGVPHTLPVAIVGAASQPGERSSRATLGTIEREVAAVGITSPAILILGRVAR